MPKKDGIEAAGEIVADQIAPVVILTAFSQRELIERARDAGAMAYLVKPFSKADLLPAIELAVARYAETAALRARGRRHQPAARGPQGHRPGQGPADDAPEDDRAGGVPLDPAHRDGSADVDAGRRRRRARRACRRRADAGRGRVSRAMPAAVGHRGTIGSLLDARACRERKFSLAPCGASQEESRLIVAHEPMNSRSAAHPTVRSTVTETDDGSRYVTAVVSPQVSGSPAGSRVATRERFM